MVIYERINDCKVEKNNSRLSLKDVKAVTKSKYSIVNDHRKSYHIIDIEGCVFQNENEIEKCDWAMEVENKIHYIELKGSDVSKGISQLLNTITETHQCFKLFSLKARLIVSKNPKPNIAKKNRKYIQLMKLVKNDFIIKQNEFIEII